MSLATLLRQTSTIENPATGVGKHGEASFGAAATVLCRFQKTTKTIVLPSGEKTPINGIVFYPASQTVSIGARVTYDSTAYRVMSVEDVPGRSGTIHHKELMVQLWSFGP